MIRLVTILLIISLGNCLGTYTYSFSSAANNFYQTPSYPLGYINGLAKLSIIVSMPFGGSTSSLTLSVMDSANAVVIQALSACTGTPCTVEWTAPSTGATYYLKASPASASLSQLVTYYLVGSVNNQIRLKVTDVLRQQIVKYFYISTLQSVSFTLSPVADTATAYLELFTATGTTNPSLGSLALPSPSISGTISTYTITLNRGSYAIAVTMPATGSAKVSVQSDSYPCPYSSAFADVYNVFTACTAAYTNPSPSGPPCATYDYDALVCLSCVDGYTLLEGSCIISTNCGARQYYNFGNCYNVSPTCGEFDPYTGACRTCSNSSQYVLSNGQCILQTVCSSGFNAVNGVCVSATCGNYSSTTGECFTCVNSAYYLTSGKCLPVDCGTGLYYSAKASKCTNLPSGCANFSLTFEVCYQCGSGYYLSQGVCSQPANSINCLLYNFNSSTCSQCNDGYYILNGGCAVNPNCGAGQSPVNGICILNPSNCNSNQVFINNQCVYLPDNCLRINTYYQCILCAPNHQIVAGVCQFCVGTNANFPCVTCASGTFANSLGICQPVNSYCASYSNTNGQCLTCTNGQAPVSGNCCDFGFSYQNGQCTQTSQTNSGSGSSGGSSGSSTSRYGPYCKTINPQLKICTSCLNGHSFDQSGACI